ncbi:DUF3964 family protein [Ectobacillus antri]|jgi:hypothetical protein|uniref:DUF3964 family protein n=1 Tax=Ectobacillus antri TaxID=2486280 RepID=A0ABT6H0X7_9BACI|nr:DUF3964 family protein [Ectobacillus antri]MDG4656203.1 DUF3964 family protein [Ectobacillus antri]MDG5752878.1 DUF3964 family protein [Ectobacillus antri]
MTTREERILSLPFFQDKQLLAKQIIQFEKETGVYLPNQFEVKQIPPYEFGERKAVIGRVHAFYFIGICKEGVWQYQAFANEMKCKEFFIALPGEDKELAFWLNNIELLA